MMNVLKPYCMTETLTHSPFSTFLTYKIYQQSHPTFMWFY